MLKILLEKGVDLNQQWFCICCLEKNVPFISLLTCSHADFLNSFAKPEIKPFKQLICHQCHYMLKKIKLFQLQVEDSLKLITAQANNPEWNKKKTTNLKLVSEIVKIDIPYTDDTQNNQPTDLEGQKIESAEIIEPTDAEIINVEDREKVNKTITDYETLIDEIQNKNDLYKDKKRKYIHEAIKIINMNQSNDSMINILTNSLKSNLSTLTNILLGGNINILNDFDIKINMLSKDNSNSTEMLSKNADSSNNHSQPFNMPTAGIRAPSLREGPLNHTTIKNETADVPSCAEISLENMNIANNKTENMSTETPDDIKMLFESENIPNETITSENTQISIENTNIANNTIENMSTECPGHRKISIVNANVKNETVTSNNTQVPIDNTTENISMESPDTEIKRFPEKIAVFGNIPNENLTSKNTDVLNEEKTKLPTVVKTESLRNRMKSNQLKNSIRNKTDYEKLNIIKVVELTGEELKRERDVIASTDSFVKSNYKCNSCLVGFEFKENLDDHIKRKHGPKPYCWTCDICLQGLLPFARSDHTQRHYFRLECVPCGKRFPFTDEFQALQHFKKEHDKIQERKRKTIPCKEPNTAKKRLAQSPAQAHVASLRNSRQHRVPARCSPSS